MTDDEMAALAEVASDMKRVAAYGHYDGFASDRGMQRYLARCRRIIPIGFVALFTHDRGMHSSGWWKNPDYEQCLHLSLSFFDPETGEPAPHDHATAAVDPCRPRHPGIPEGPTTKGP